MRQPLIVLYDAECVLCSNLVRYIVDHDNLKLIRFASLTSDPARNLVQLCSRSAESGDDAYFQLPDSIVVIEGAEMYTESDAALKIARCMSGPVRMLGSLRFVPKLVRDAVYRLVAKYRYRWFGKFDACPLPSPELRSRILTDQDLYEYSELIAPDHDHQSLVH